MATVFEEMRQRVPSGSGWMIEGWSIEVLWEDKRIVSLVGLGRLARLDLCLIEWHRLGVRLGRVVLLQLQAVVRWSNASVDLGECWSGSRALPLASLRGFFGSCGCSGAIACDRLIACRRSPAARIQLPSLFAS